jgi:hypothetical protein
MDYNIPRHVSPATLVRAARLAKNAKSIGIYPGAARWADTGDYVYFMFKNKHDDFILIYACPHTYFVELYEGTNDEVEHEQYFMLKNIRNFLYKLRSLGYYDCEHLKKRKDDDSRA